MNISQQLSDDAILAEIGARIMQHRLKLQLTQAALAEQAGVGKRTVERIEAGNSAQFSSLIRLFRVLELLSGMEAAIPEATSGPMDLLKRKGKQRKRASGKKVPDQSGGAWTWGNES